MYIYIYKLTIHFVTYYNCMYDFKFHLHDRLQNDNVMKPCLIQRSHKIFGKPTKFSSLKKKN